MQQKPYSDDKSRRKPGQSGNDPTFGNKQQGNDPQRQSGTPEINRQQQGGNPQQKPESNRQQSQQVGGDQQPGKSPKNDDPRAEKNREPIE